MQHVCAVSCICLWRRRDRCAQRETASLPISLSSTRIFRRFAFIRNVLVDAKSFILVFYIARTRFLAVLFQIATHIRHTMTTSTFRCVLWIQSGSASCLHALTYFFVTYLHRIHSYFTLNKKITYPMYSRKYCIKINTGLILHLAVFELSITNAEISCFPN